MDRKVVWSKGVAKRLDRVPSFIRDKFMAWALVVERVGLEEARKLPSYHDEPLKGERKGQRSIRLNRAYRVVYVEGSSGEIRVLELSKHAY